MLTNRPYVARCLALVLLLTLFAPRSAHADSSEPSLATSSEVIETVGQIGGAVTCVTVRGDYAYLGVGPRMVILDVSDPTTPTKMSQTELFGRATAHISQIELIGDRAFVVADDTLYWVDVSDVAAPVEMGVVPGTRLMQGLPDGYSTYGMRVAVEGTTLCVAETSEWWSRYSSSGHVNTDLFHVDPDGTVAEVSRIVEASDPNLGIPIDPSDIEFQPGTLWVVGDTYGWDEWKLRSYVIEGVTLVEEGEPLDVGGHPSHIACFGEHLFLLEERDPWHTTWPPRMRVIDVREPLSPTLVATLPISGCLDAEIAGDGLLFAAGGDHLTVFDISDPLAPAELVHADIAAVDVELANSLVYIASGPWLRLLALEPNGSFREIATWREAGMPTMATVGGDLAYVTDGSELLYVIDLTDPTAPVLVGEHMLDGTIVDMAAIGDYVYLTLADSVRVVDCTDPASPVQVADIQGPADGENLSIRGYVEWVYVLSEGNNLTMFSTFDPSLEWLPQDQLHLPSLDSLEQVSRDYALVTRAREGTDDDTFEIAPVALHDGPSIPPLEVWSERTRARTNVKGSVVLVGGDYYDFTSQAEFEWVASAESWNWSWGTAEQSFSSRSGPLSNRYEVIYGRWTSEYGGVFPSAPEMFVVDVSDPNAIRRIAHVTMRTPASAVLSDDVLLHCNGDAGLAILQLSDAPPPSVVELSALPPDSGMGGENVFDTSASGCFYSSGGFSSPSVGTPTFGDYYIWLRVRGIFDPDRPFGVYGSINSGNVAFAPDASEPHDAWQWLRSDGTLTLPKGPGFLDVYCLSGLDLDCLVATNDPSYVPEGIITPCVPQYTSLPLIQQ